jgi:hypothetical protein
MFCGVMPRREAVARSNVRTAWRPCGLQVARDVGSSGSCLSGRRTSRRTRELGRARILQAVLVLRPADDVLDRDVLHRLHVEADALHLGHGRLQPRMTSDAPFALRQRLEVDLDAAAVERRVRAVDADERGQALDRGILEDLRGQLLLQARHLGERHALVRLGDALDLAGVLHREEALRNDDVEEDRDRQRRDRDHQGQRAVHQHPVERAP